jgi:hypothetical protein
MHRNESSDHSDHREFLDAIGPRLTVGVGAAGRSEDPCPLSWTDSVSDLSG